MVRLKMTVKHGQRFAISLTDEYTAFIEIYDGKFFVDFEVTVYDDDENKYVHYQRKLFRWERIMPRKWSQKITEKSIEKSYDVINRELGRLRIDGELTLNNEK